MAALADYADLHDRLDWGLLRYGTFTLFRQHETLEEALTWLREHGYTIRRADSSTWTWELPFITDMIEQYEVTGCHGYGLYSLRDGLVSIEVPGDGGLVWVFDNFHAWVEAAPDFARDALATIAEGAHDWLVLGRRWIVLLRSDNEYASFGPFGGYFIQRYWVESEGERQAAYQAPEQTLPPQASRKPKKRKTREAYRRRRTSR